MSEYTFQLPIGDWSGDGHGQCQWFAVVSNKPVEAVRQAHVKGINDVFDIHAVCGDYGDTHVPDAVRPILPKWVRAYFDDLGYPIDGARSLALLWIDILQRADPELTLTIVEQPNLLCLEDGLEDRASVFVGYGLFG